MRLLDFDDIEHLALGAALLGGGGGGEPYLSKLVARHAIATYGPVRLIDPTELDDDALVVSLGMIGAPTVGVERPFAKDTYAHAFELLQRHLGRPIDAVMTIEIGGGNALAPIQVAARLGLPMVDADAMGRALPELQMTSFGAYGLSATPLSIVADNGNRTVIEAADNYWAEQLARSMTIEMGGAVASASYPVSGRQLKQAGILHTVSHAIAVGRAVQATRSNSQSILATIQDVLRAALLFEGKVIDVHRRTDIGFARGQALIEGVGSYQSSKLSIEFQNEYLIAKIDQVVRASVPDLIGIFDLRTGAPISVEVLRYGFQVAVLSVPAPAVWRTPAGLALVGPRAFGYAIDDSLP